MFDVCQGFISVTLRNKKKSMCCNHSCPLFSSSCSILMSSATPSYIFWTAWNSVIPILSRLLMSYLPPTASLCSPDEPRTLK